MKLEDLQSKLFILVGVPASGKSTWTNAHRQSGWVIVSSDDILDKFAQLNDMTYSEAWKKFANQADAMCKKEFINAIEQNETIVVDRTNMSKKSRTYWLSQTPDNYKKIAVVFQVPDEELERRSAEREATTGKHIPKEVVASMKASFQAPSYEEGFDEIINF